MQECAQAEQWDGLIELEQIRTSIIEHLIKHDNGVLWRNGELDKKSELIRSILEVDGETKRLAQGWKGELQEILGSIDNEKKINKAYETP